MSKALQKLTRGKIYAKRPMKALPQVRELKHEVEHLPPSAIPERLAKILRNKGWQLDQPECPDPESSPASPRTG